MLAVISNCGGEHGGTRKAEDVRRFCHGGSRKRADWRRARIFDRSLSELVEGIWGGEGKTFHLEDGGKEFPSCCDL